MMRLLGRLLRRLRKAREGARGFRVLREVEGGYNSQGVRGSVVMARALQECFCGEIPMECIATARSWLA